MALVNKRSLQDVNLKVTLALPATGATVTTNSIDLATTTAFRVPGVELLISVPAAPNLADTKNIVFTIQDSADNATFAAVPTAGVFTITGASGAGAAAATYQSKLPLGLRRYVRVSATADASAGNSTAVTFTFALVF